MAICISRSKDCPKAGAGLKTRCSARDAMRSHPCHQAAAAACCGPSRNDARGTRSPRGRVPGLGRGRTCPAGKPAPNPRGSAACGNPAGSGGIMRKGDTSMPGSLFTDLIEIASGNIALATARIEDFSKFSDRQHAAALSTRRKSTQEPAREADMRDDCLGVPGAGRRQARPARAPGSATAN